MPNVTVSLYAGELDYSFECSGAKKCKHALCEVMPALDDKSCAYRYYGLCNRDGAQIIAMEKAVKMMKAKIREMKDDAEQ